MTEHPPDRSTAPRTARVWRGLPGGRLARRLFVLFVAAALVPLLLSGWLALSAVTRIADDLQQQAHVDRTREVSRQVLDRLIAARDVMAMLPDPADAGSRPAPAPLPGLGSTFARLEGFDAQGRRLVSRGATPLPSPQPQPTAVHRHAASPSRHTLVIELGPGAAPRVLLDRHVDDRLAWRAELDAGSLWRPVLEGAVDTRWRVVDAQGRSLLVNEPGDDLGDVPRVASVALPLDGLFEGGSWQFRHEAPRVPIQFMGSSLAQWLALLALGTVLGVALLAHWRIRRVFRPLEALTEGTRRLAAGDTAAGVAAPARARFADEIDELAGSFNDMAGRIDEQLGTLRELAAIDHDILRGAPLDLVAMRLMGEVLRTMPSAVVAISWRDADVSGAGDDGPGVQILRSDAAGRLSTATAPGLPAPEALARDEAARGGAWWPEPLQDDWRSVWRTVERDGRLAGLIALAMPPAAAASPERLDALRDRLAVALAARRRDRELAWRAAHDSLTGLLNRFGLHEWLDHRLPEGLASGEAPCLALMLIDLDHFKDVNDTRGHDAGDALLCQVAQRLLGAVPPAAVVARLGGDEFVVLLPGAAAAEAMALADRVCAQLKEPFSVADVAVVVGASAGIAVAPGHGRSRQELTRRADIALYTAKARRGSVCLFDESQDRATAERAAWVAELREAIARRRFKLHYQPRVSAADGHMVSVEALVRWQHPRHGLLPPDRFIPIAEHAGLMGELGALVLDEACLQMAAWRLAGVPVRKVSVNVSMQQLLTGRLPHEVRETLARHAVPPQALELEVTESLLADDADSAQDQLRQLRALGIEIALDDFGTGYSAMSQLRRLPIDVMKIDRSFVVDVGSDDGALAIARAIIALAGALGLRVVAEGVETAEHARRLRELGCDELQGYHFARPLPADELVAFALGEPVRLAMSLADTVPA